jgi:SAM-dependent methyltransferase
MAWEKGLSTLVIISKPMRILKHVYFFMKFFGLDPIMAIKHLTGLPFYLRSYKELKRQRGSDGKFSFGSFKPFLRDRFAAAGVMAGQYFVQDLLVARRIFARKPVRHVDVGSRIDGFVAHVAVFREIEVLDIRDQKSTAKNILFRRADLTKLPIDMINYCDSLSSLHAIEHFGLGRYGDPINYLGYLDALNNIYKILKTGGIFYFSVPIGTQRIEFNSQRIFSIYYLLELFKPQFDVVCFSYMNDKGILYEDVKLSDEVLAECSALHCGLGIFELYKRPTLD